MVIASRRWPWRRRRRRRWRRCRSVQFQYQNLIIYKHRFPFAKLLLQRPQRLVHQIRPPSSFRHVSRNGSIFVVVGRCQGASPPAYAAPAADGDAPDQRLHDTSTRKNSAADQCLPMCLDTAASDSPNVRYFSAVDFFRCGHYLLQCLTVSWRVCLHFIHVQANRLQQRVHHMFGLTELPPITTIAVMDLYGRMRSTGHISLLSKCTQQSPRWPHTATK